MLNTSSDSISVPDTPTTIGREGQRVDYAPSIGSSEPTTGMPIGLLLILTHSD